MVREMWGSKRVSRSVILGRSWVSRVREVGGTKRSSEEYASEGIGGVASFKRGLEVEGSCKSSAEGFFEEECFFSSMVVGDCSVILYASI